MARSPRHSSQICEKLQTAMDLLGKRWTGLLVSALQEGPLRFSQIAERMEVIGDKMLSERLKELEVAGIVERQVLAEPVVRVQYSLTRKGRGLNRVLAQISRWAEEWVALPAEQRKASR
jgi:DNA-binding HxlR family transcriptional regulator